MIRIRDSCFKLSEQKTNSDYKDKYVCCALTLLKPGTVRTFPHTDPKILFEDSMKGVKRTTHFVPIRAQDGSSYPIQCKILIYNNFMFIVVNISQFDEQ